MADPRVVNPGRPGGDVGARRVPAQADLPGACLVQAGEQVAQPVHGRAVRTRRDTACSPRGRRRASGQLPPPRPAPGCAARAGPQREGVARRHAGADAVLAAGTARGPRLAFSLDRAAALVARMVDCAAAPAVARPDQLRSRQAAACTSTSRINKLPLASGILAQLGILVGKSHERRVAGHGVSQAHLFQLGQCSPGRAVAHVVGLDQLGDTRHPITWL